MPDKRQIAESPPKYAVTRSVGARPPAKAGTVKAAARYVIATHRTALKNLERR